MADKKITALTELTAAPDVTDLLHLVDGPAGTPVNKRLHLVHYLAEQFHHLVLKYRSLVQRFKLLLVLVLICLQALVQVLSKLLTVQ